MPLNDVLIFLRFLITVFLLSLTSLPQEDWVSRLNVSHVTFSHVSCFEMNERRVLCESSNGSAVYLHVQSVFAQSSSCVRGTINLSSKDSSAGMRRSMCGPNHSSECILHAYIAAVLCSAAFMLSVFGSFFLC
jgi:hypothetical protein